jgi:hypothetical protein
MIELHVILTQKVEIKNCSQAVAASCRLQEHHIIYN